jgi:hypothetical protein
VNGKIFKHEMCILIFLKNSENTRIWQDKNLRRFHANRLIFIRQTDITNIVTLHACPLNMPDIQVKEDVMWMTQQHLHSAGDNDQEHFIGLNELVYLKIN